MKIRWKFLAFMGVFLMGSFMIVTWKSYSIFSQKYSQALQSAELQNLDKQARYIHQQFVILQNLVREPEQLENRLKSSGVELLAHVVSENGKWKAQWFEGESGSRREAPTITQQIPFESLSTTKKSWHMVQLKSRQTGLAYVIPAADKDKMSYYAFFFTRDYLQSLFKGQSYLESVTVFSPQIGTVYSVGEFNESLIDKNAATLKGQQHGVIAAGNGKSLLFTFQPDLQLYLLKTQNSAVLQIESPFYLLTLLILVGFFIALAVVSMDLLLKSVFQRLEQVTSTLRAQAPSAPSQASHFGDELQELEYLSHYIADGGAVKAQEASAPAPVVPAAPVVDEGLLAQLRPKAINSLGYLHRIKAQVPTSPNVTLLEKELRELRNLIDPIGTTPSAPQPYFNPILETFKKETAFASAENEPATADNAAAIAGSAFNVRKPKRENNESQKL